MHSVPSGRVRYSLCGENARPTAQQQEDAGNRGHEEYKAQQENQKCSPSGKARCTKDRLEYSPHQKRSDKRIYAPFFAAHQGGGRRNHNDVHREGSRDGKHIEYTGVRQRQDLAKVGRPNPDRGDPIQCH